MALEAETLNPIVETLDARQMAGREQLARGAGQWFVTEKVGARGGPTQPSGIR